MIFQSNLLNQPAKAANSPPIFGPTIFGLFALTLVTKTLINYYLVKNPSGDIAIFVQMFYNTLDGHFLESSFENGNHLGVHFSPILVFLIPVMAVVKSFPGLILTNGLFLVLGLWMLYRHLHAAHPLTAVIITIMLMCHSTLTHDSTKSFHALSMMTLPFVGIFIAYRHQHFRQFLGWCLLLTLIRENMFLTLFSWGCICFFTKRPLRWVLAPIALAAVHFLVASLIVPAWLAGGIRPSITDYYLDYGQGLGGIFAHLMNDPLMPARYLFTSEKGIYLYKIMLPFLIILPCFRPRWLLPACPTLAVILFSSNGRLADPKLHFSVEVVLWMAIATIYFLQDHEQKFERPKWRMALTMLAITFALFLSATFVVNCAKLVMGPRTGRFQAISQIAGSIAPNDRVAAPRYIANYLAWRKEIHFLTEVESLDLWSGIDVLVLEGKDLARAPENWKVQHQQGAFHLLIPPDQPP